MTTLYLEWNGDLKLECRTSLQLATGWDEVRQRIIRRLITNCAQTLPDGRFTPADYIFDNSYGDGLGSMVDQNFTDTFLGALEQRIYAGVLADAAVDTSIPPTIKFARPMPEMLVIYISVILVTGQEGNIQLAVSR